MWLSPVQVVAPLADPVTREEAKTFCRLDGTDLDQQVDGFIDAARAQLELVTGTRLVTQRVRVRTGDWADLGVLPIGPVQSVDEIGYFAADGSEQTVDPSNYDLVDGGLEPSIAPAIGTGWPTAAARRDAISVTLSVGYGSAAQLPRDLWLAVLMLVRGMVDERPADIDHLLVNRRMWA